MGSSSIIGEILAPGIGGLVATGIDAATGGSVSDAIWEGSSVFSEGKSDGSDTTVAATTTTKDGEDKLGEGKADTAEGGEDIYNDGRLSKNKQKKATLIGEGNTTFSLDDNASLGV